MSKRYGRNQKRQAKERIAALELSTQDAVSALRSNQDQIDQYQYWESELNRIVPRYSMLRKNVEIMDIAYDPGDQYYTGFVPRGIPQ